MKIDIGLCVVAAFLLAVPAMAQSSADRLTGHWVGNGAFCGSTVLVVTAVEPNGAVRGTLDCSKQGFVMTLADKPEYRKTFKAKFAGKKLDLEGTNSSGYELALDGDKLTGMALGGPGVRNPIVFARQK